MDGSPFYLGLDNNHGNNTDLVTVLLHEFSHGFGFQTFTNASTGAQTGGFPAIYDRFLLDDTSGQTWAQMTSDSQRQASAINTNNLTWSGPVVTNDVHSTLATPLLKVNSPAGIAGNYTVGTAAFGSPLATSGVTASLVQGSPADGCASMASFSGKLALIDRGSCNFTVKVKNAQNAGAIGVVIANNDSANPTVVVQMGGSDSSIVIPAVSISFNNGNTIKGQLGGGVNATMRLDTSLPGGVCTTLMNRPPSIDEATPSLP